MSEGKCSSGKPSSIADANTASDVDDLDKLAYPDEDGDGMDCPQPEAAYEERLNPEAIRRLRRRISNRESARRLRKQRNEKLTNLMSQQDNLEGLCEGLKAQIESFKRKLEYLNCENKAMMIKLGDEPTDVLRVSEGHLAACNQMSGVRPCCAATVNASKSSTMLDSTSCPSTSTTRSLPERCPSSTETRAQPSAAMPPPPPPSAGRAAAGAKGAGLETPSAVSVPKSASDEGKEDTPTGSGTSSGAARAVAAAKQMTTRSAQRAINPPKVDLRQAIQELTNVKVGASGGSVGAAAAARAAAAAAAAALVEPPPSTMLRGGPTVPSGVTRHCSDFGGGGLDGGGAAALGSMLSVCAAQQWTHSA